ncbi:hypothetical protein L1887_47145 [Cichorium endivia]|nr:hypothetical protein L1887_47145 [Cichorium endivia]
MRSSAQANVSAAHPTRICAAPRTCGSNGAGRQSVRASEQLRRDVLARVPVSSSRGPAPNRLYKAPSYICRCERRVEFRDFEPEAAGISKPSPPHEFKWARRGGRAFGGGGA